MSSPGAMGDVGVGRIVCRRVTQTRIYTHEPFTYFNTRCYWNQHVSMIIQSHASNYNSTTSLHT